jgi:hypothetical protein
MHGVGLDEDVRIWFEPPEEGPRNSGRQRRRRNSPYAVPATTVPSNLIEQCLA